MINLDRIDRVYAKGLMPLDAVQVDTYHAKRCASWRGEDCDCDAGMEIVSADGDRIAIDQNGNIIPPARGNG
jgi:hypothetical protein